MKNKGFGHLKARLFTIKTSKNVGLGGPWYVIPAHPTFISPGKWTSGYHHEYLAATPPRSPRNEPALIVSAIFFWDVRWCN